MMQNRTESKSTLQDSPLGCTFDHDFCLLALLDQIKAFFNFILEKFRALSAKSICLHCSIKQTLEIFTLKCFVHTTLLPVACTYASAIYKMLFFCSKYMYTLHST